MGQKVTKDGQIDDEQIILRTNVMYRAEKQRMNNRNLRRLQAWETMFLKVIKVRQGKTE